MNEILDQASKLIRRFPVFILNTFVYAQKTIVIWLDNQMFQFALLLMTQKDRSSKITWKLALPYYNERECTLIHNWKLRWISILLNFATKARKRNFRPNAFSNRFLGQDY